MEKHHLAVEGKFSSTEWLFLRVPRLVLPPHPLLMNRCDVLRLQNSYISSLELAENVHISGYIETHGRVEANCAGVPMTPKRRNRCAGLVLIPVSSRIRLHLIERGGVFTLVKVVIILGGNSWKRPCKSSDSGGVQGVSALRCHRRTLREPVKCKLQAPLHRMPGA